jgi:glycosyltransferase involved in cell wall biosynthesis
MTAKPVNILYLSSFGDIMRGGQKSLFNLVSGLNREAFGVYVVVPTKNGGLAERLKNKGINVNVVEFPRILDYHLLLKVKALSKLLKLMAKYQIDIIHTDGPRNTFYAGIAAKVKNIPLIWHVRVSNHDRYDRILTKLSSRIILVADTLRSRFKINSNDKKFVTIHNGVDLDKFRTQEHEKLVRQRYNIDNNELLISVAARIERPKGQKYLIEACGKLKNRIKSFHILLAGEITDNSYMNDCSKMAIKFGIHDRVIFAGPLNNINQVLNETDIFVLPSLFEAFPRSIIEAMAAGIPVIATDVGGNTEAIENNVSGLIIPSRDSNALAEKIYLLGQNPKLRLKIGAEARNRAIKFFGIRENVKKTEDIYRELLFNDSAT